MEIYRIKVLFHGISSNNRTLPGEPNFFRLLDLGVLGKDSA